MADRSTSEQGSTREHTSGQTGQQAAGGTEARSRTERERGVETGREVGRPRRGTPSTPRGLTPYTGQVTSPFTLMRRMMDDMDRFAENIGFGRGLGLSPWRGLDELDEPSRLPSTRQAAALWAPPLEVFERGNDLVVRADLPGLSKDDVNVEVDNGILTISGERRSEHEEDRQGYYRSERSYGSFARSVALPEGVSEEQCNATFKDGVLEVTMPKPKEEQRRGRRINIK